MALKVDESNPLAALGPIDWDTVDRDNLDSFLTDTLACAQLLVDSIPAASISSSAYTGKHGRQRSHTDGAVSYGWSGAAAADPANPTASDSADEQQAALDKAKKCEKIRQDLQRSWKEVSASGANPRDIAVYKMNGGREGYAGSSWFARRSLHRVEKAKGNQAGTDGQDVVIEFDMFRRALLKEFAIQGEEEDSNSEAPSTVRTMSTKKRLEHITFENNTVDAQPAKVESETKTNDNKPSSTRHLNIYLLEAVFPGPTATRDFVTMQLTAQSPYSMPDETSKTTNQDSLRQFIIVSKPCNHPETPARQGYVRAQYESVELIREVRVPVQAQSGKPPSSAKNMRKTQSSVDLSHAHLNGSTGPDVDHGDDAYETAIEWLMITRNNPGGNVPRFLVDKSTPSSIISDTNKFMDWLVAQELKANAQSADKSETSAATSSTTVDDKNLPTKGTAEHIIPEEDEEEATQQIPTRHHFDATADDRSQQGSGRSPSVSIRSVESSGGAASSAKLFSMITGVLGGAVPAVASKLPNPFVGAVEVLNPPLEAFPDIEDDADTGGETYSNIDDDGVAEDEIARGRCGQPVSGSTQSQDVAASMDSTMEAYATSARSLDNSSTASVAPPKPMTALEILAHKRAVALGRLDDFTSAKTDSENEIETGLHRDTVERIRAKHSAAQAAKVAKAVEVAKKRHETQLKMLDERHRKAEETLLKQSDRKDHKEERNSVDGVKTVQSIAGSESASKAPASVSGTSIQGASEHIGANDWSSTSSISTTASYSTDLAMRTKLEKLRKKHKEAVARQEAQYHKEIMKLDHKRQQLVDKDAARLRKQLEREEKADMAKQLVRVQAERDSARKEVEMLDLKVRRLDAQNELLVAEVAKLKGTSSSVSESV
ncbi:hypothetical protein SEPCBS57363_004255 [Sporothrix epigloea]|uniref:DUF3074 domain-containing protein n=1 Tax=Sporothrix epigloea TaxID=1892477 RepID=A0ABP0DR03_9PEZI